MWQKESYRTKEDYPVCTKISNNCDYFYKNSQIYKNTYEIEDKAITDSQYDQQLKNSSFPHYSYCSDLANRINQQFITEKKKCNCCNTSSFNYNYTSQNQKYLYTKVPSLNLKWNDECHEIPAINEAMHHNELQSVPAEENKCIKHFVTKNFTMNNPTDIEQKEPLKNMFSQQKNYALMVPELNRESSVFCPCVASCSSEKVEYKPANEPKAYIPSEFKCKFPKIYRPRHDTYEILAWEVCSNSQSAASYIKKKRKHNFFLGKPSTAPVEKQNCEKFESNQNRQTLNEISSPISVEPSLFKENQTCCF